ncbi:MAG: ligA [Frankiales bacterium]|nr:ligA [Frankiales bacterium]
MSRLPLDGETVVVTGEVPDMERDAAQQAARELGAKVVSSVTATTTLVVHGPGAGRSKLDKATARGLRLLDAAAFAALAVNPDSWDGERLGEPAGAARDDDLDRELPRTSSRPAEPQHRLNTTSASPGGVWTVWGSCRCGEWKVRVDSTAEARARYAEHHVDEPDDEALTIAQLQQGAR